MFFIKNDHKYFSKKIKSAFLKNDKETVSKLIEGVNIKEIKDSKNSTLLHLAVKIKSNKIIKFLIDSGCDINAQDQSGATPLFIAVKLCNFSAIEKLLEAKANIFLSDNKGINCLKATLEISLRNRLPVIESFANQLKQCGLNGNELAPLILEAGWPIHYAMYIGNSEIIKFMLEAGCPVDSCDEGDLGYTALHIAALNGYAESVKILLQYGADTDIISERGSTPFTLAFPRANVLETILDSRPLLDRFNTDGMIESFKVFSNLEPQVIELLLLKYKINLTVKDREGNTFLHALAKNQRSEVISLLYKANFDVNIKNNQGDTLLHYAVGYSNMDGIEMLIDKGADLNAKNNNDDIPLINALNRHADEKELEILIENGTILNEDTQNLILKKVREKNITAHMIGPILKRMAIMHVQGKAVTKENFCLMKGMSNGQYHFELYLQELRSMKYYLLTENSDISFFDIFCASDQQLLNYARNEDIVDTFFKCDVSNKFQIFGESMRKRFEIAKIKQNLIQDAIDALSKNIKQLNCNLKVIENIVKYLRLNDLQHLRMSSTPPF